MSRVVWAASDPYDGVAESEVTSNVLHVSDAIAWTFIATRPSGNTASIITCQVSNWTGKDPGAVPDGTFASHTTVAGDGDDAAVGDAGYRYVRFQRSIVSGVSQDVAFNKMIG